MMVIQLVKKLSISKELTPEPYIHILCLGSI